MEKTWTIVKFCEDNSIAVVPTEWIIQKDECLWPPFTSDRVTIAIKTCQMNSCWPTHKIDSFRNATYDSYDIAFKKLKIAEEKSDLNTEDEEVPFKRRRVQKRLSTSSSEDDILHAIKTPPKLHVAKSIKVNDKIRVSKNLSTPRASPKISTLIKCNEESLPLDKDFGKENLLDNSIYKTPKMTPATCPKTIEPTTSKTPDCSGTNYCSCCPVHGPKTIEPTTSKTPDCSGTNYCSCCPVHVQYFPEIVRQLGFITSLVKEVLVEVKRSNVMEALRAEHESVLKDFIVPMTEVDHLLLFHEKLNEEEFFQKAVTEFTSVGGRNTYDFVTRCLKRLISDKLAVQYSWLGRRGKQKFQALNISNLIFSAAQKAGCTSSAKQTEDSISQWLRRAHDRLKIISLKNV